MNTRIAIVIALMVAAAAQAADPSVGVDLDKGTKPVPAAARTASRPPLKLGIGDVRKYMMPNDFQAALSAPDSDKTTVVVQGERPPPPLKSEMPQPTGLGAVYSLFRHPTSAWRLFLPDTSAYAPQDGPPDVVPQREFRWGP